MAASSSLSPPPSPSYATPLPWGQLSVLFLAQLAEPITSTVIYPFIAQLVLELGLVSSPAQTGYYAGVVESIFFATEAVCVLHWGRLSDAVGRRPVLMGGLSGLAASMLAFGLAAKPGTDGVRRFIGVVLARALAGALNGNVGVSKSAMAELTDETNMARAFAFMPIVWSLGSSIGPFIGGGLAHPYERFPGTVFGRLAFFRDWPYFLPCATAAAFSVLVCIATAVWFRETAAPVDDEHPYADDPELLAGPGTEETPLLRPPPSPTSPAHSRARSLRDIVTPRLKATVTAYALLALTDIGYLALQPLFMSSPVSAGGLGLEPSVIGWWMGSAGAINLPVQALLFPRLHARLGEKRVFLLGACAFCLLWPLWAATWASAAALGPAWRAQPGAGTVWALLAASFVAYMGTQFCFAAIFIFVSHAAPRAQLGAANGLAQTATSAMRAVGPAALTSLWAWSAGHLQAPTTLYSALGSSAPAFVSTPRWRAGEVGIPLSACTVYAVLGALSVALVWSSTKLIEGRPESVYSGYGSQRQSRVTLASTSSGDCLE
ncbi:MFS general substrate transporter [Auricularia subglabra TFB-10046 SS5]|uniref:MFS general substrate transporter n=1 Tax=Auricularia subglabra (strain TFB-10046 / SS5) TaxID=717982 RepID=J0WVT2_AURST|nr:MFS general substrate transporter [Auricularia subglabra TFB-10046 SS5]